MAKTRQQKEQIVSSLSDKLSVAKSAVVSSVTKLSVNDDCALRSKMFENNVSYEVVPKTLLKRALEKANLDVLDITDARGNITVAISEDEVLAAKTVHEFSKEHDGISVLGGYLEKSLVDGGKIKALAGLPSKEELIAKTVWTIKGPLSGIANVLAGPTRSLVYALNAIKETKS